MRITFVAPLSSSGGMRVIQTYAHHLGRRGHRVLILSALPARPGLRACLRAVLSGRGWPSRPRQIPWFRRRADVEHRILDHPGPVMARDVPEGDVVVATWWRTAPWVADLPPSRGAKVYFVQDYGVAGQTLEQIVPTWSLPLRLVTISRFLVDLIGEHVPRKAALVPDAVDSKHFDAPPRGRQRVPTIGFVYSPYWSKGCDLCIDAAVLARRSERELRLLSFGSKTGPHRSFPLPDWAEPKWRLPDAELPAVYAGCDAWLFGSRLEGFGLPILEAMACRTPVVAVEGGAAPELLRGGGGILVRPRHAEAMAEGIVRLLRLDETAWRTMSEAARATAARYTWEDATDLLESVLQEAAEGREVRRDAAGRAAVPAHSPERGGSPCGR